jgi:hypothetical protein
MDQSIEPLFVAYIVPGATIPIVCPMSDAPPGATVLHSGTQQQCERFTRDAHYLREAAHYLREAARIGGKA